MTSGRPGVVSPMLREHTVIAWLLPVSGKLSAVLGRDTLALLDDWETQRVESLRDPEDRVCFVAAHALARVVLSELHPVPLKSWRLKRDPRGKLLVSEPSSASHLHFSISHARGMVGCIAAKDAQVGLDIEPLDPNLEFQPILPHALALAEHRAWPEIPQPQGALRFLRHWTLKEAMLKAVGLGLAVDPSSVQLTIGPDGVPSVSSIPSAFGHRSEWRTCSATPLGTHVLGLAARCDPDVPFNLRWRCVPAACLSQACSTQGTAA